MRGQWSKSYGMRTMRTPSLPSPPPCAHCLTIDRLTAAECSALDQRTDAAWQKRFASACCCRPSPLLDSIDPPPRRTRCPCSQHYSWARCALYEPLSRVWLPAVQRRHRPLWRMNQHEPLSQDRFGRGGRRVRSCWGMQLTSALDSMHSSARLYKQVDELIPIQGI